jgi:hypothetical protein
VVNLKPPILPPPEPPPTGFCLNHFSTDELLAIDCVSFLHQNHHGCIGLVFTLLVSLLEKVEIPTQFRDGIYFFSNRVEIRDRKSS